jgi:CRP/FNR family cyclic AMP-dependent transcriptional regulator
MGSVGQGTGPDGRALPHDRLPGATADRGDSGYRGGTMDRIELVKAIPLFESLDDEDLHALAHKLREVRVEAGARVFAQGDQGDAMYLIESGAVDIVAGSGKQQVIVGALFKQQYFGELALLDGAPRSATAVASRPTQLLALDRDDFVEFIKKRPDAALAIMHEVGERMRATNELMTRTVTRNVLEEEDRKLTVGERIADMVAAFGGSWPFIFMFGGFMLVWMVWNSLFGPPLAFDPLPFMFLNLFLSTLAALQAPIIMMSQNRQATKDKALAVNDFQINLKNEVAIDKILRNQSEVLLRLNALEQRLVAHRASGLDAVKS